MSNAIAKLDELITELAVGLDGSACAAPAPALAEKQKQQPPPKQPKQAAEAQPVPPAAAASSKPVAPDPDLERKYALVRSVGEECVTDAELKNLLSKKPAFVLYDGFEPSGRMHIAQGVFKAMNVNKCTQAGGTFIFWVADWFALMNDKMGGDLERIKTVGQYAEIANYIVSRRGTPATASTFPHRYLIQVWTAAGMDMSRVKFMWSEEEIGKNPRAYWTQVMTHC